MAQKSKICIIGAGKVGSTIAYTLASQTVAREIVLIDVLKDKAAGEVADIKDGLCSWGELDMYAGDYEDVKDASLIILTAGTARKPGESRIDLAQRNLGITRAITDELMKHYNTGSILVVSNPVDILTYAVSEWTGLPEGRVFGTGTLLDSARFRSLLADMINVNIVNLHGYVIGEHGDSQVPIWSNTHVAGAQIDKYCANQSIPLTDPVKQEIEQTIIRSGAEIIRLKGATFYGISSCVCSLVSAIMRDSNSIFTVSSRLRGQFGLHDVAISLPSLVTYGGLKTIYEPNLTPAERERLLASAESCRKVLSSLSL